MKTTLTRIAIGLLAVVGAHGSSNAGAPCNGLPPQLSPDETGDTTYTSFLDFGQIDVFDAGFGITQSNWTAGGLDYG